MIRQEVPREVEGIVSIKSSFFHCSFGPDIFVAHYIAGLPYQGNCIGN